MGLAQRKTEFTLEEYLAFERRAETRHEYTQGQIEAMAGESFEHSIICANLSRRVGDKLEGTGCRTLSPNMKIKTAARADIYYADLLVLCGPPIFHDDRRDVLCNPQIIFEVLSASTEARDRGGKFADYQTIDSLVEYVLIDQYKSCVEVFTKQANGTWLYDKVEGLERTVYLPSVKCDLSLAAIYQDVVFQL
jgi:Uma2 family endonuclease